MRRNPIRWGMMAFLTLLLAVTLTALAQEACPELIEQALAELNGNCGGMDRNSACYGFNRVDATFNAEVEDGFFSDPADRSQLVTLQTIATAPLDTELERWGIAVLNAQANVPNSLPGQAVTFMLVGEVQLENAVPPDQAFVGGEPVAVEVLTGSNLRSFPSTNANIVATATRGDELQADGISPDKQWLRVLSPTGSAWISISLIDATADLSSLPEVTQETRSPMQAFYFSTGTSEPDCNEVPPSTLVVQGPEHFRVNLTANGADIRIASTIGLRTLENGQMQLFVIDGSAIVEGITVPPGFTMFLPLSEDGKSPGGAWTGLRTMTAEELEGFKTLELFEGDFLHYPIHFPELADIMQTLAAIQSGGGGSGVSGNTSVGGAGNANMCKNFKPTSPFGRLPFETLLFYWDGANGASNYRLTIYHENGSVVYQRTTNGGETSLPVDAGGLGPGANFTWVVEALLNGQVACTSARVTVTRDGDPNAPPPAPDAPDVPFTVSYSCSMYTAAFTWSGLPATDTITISFSDYMGARGGTYSGASGSANYTGIYMAGPVSVTTSGGESRSFGADNCL